MSGDLLERINAAVKSANEAERSVAAAKTEFESRGAELGSRSKIVGQLLLEAKELHPAQKDFEAFLKGVKGLGLSRAYDCMRIAGGRTTDDEIRQATKARVKKHRDKKKSKTLPKLSVTRPDVTDPAEQPKTGLVETAHLDPDTSADVMRAKLAALDDLSIPPCLDRTTPPTTEEIVQDAAAQSENEWIEIKTFLDARLPRLLAVDKLRLFAYIINHPALAAVKMPKRQKVA